MTALVLPTDAPAMPGPPQGHWTYADWEELPDDGNRYEIIDGVLYMTTAPNSFHQWIVNRLERHITIPAEDQGLAFAFTAPIGVLMPGCDPVQPDFVVVLASRKSIFREGRIRGVPDLLVEILSPSNKAYDRQVKLDAYARASAPEYAIIDPRARTPAEGGSFYFRLRRGTGPLRISARLWRGGGGELRLSADDLRAGRRSLCGRTGYHPMMGDRGAVDGLAMPG